MKVSAQPRTVADRVRRPGYTYLRRSSPSRKRLNTNGSKLFKLAAVTRDGLKVVELESATEDLVSARTPGPGEGAKFSRGASSGSMAVWSGERIGPATTRDLLEQIAGGERGAQLRATVARWNPSATSEQIEEAYQEACARAELSCVGRSEGEVYVWLRTTTHREVGRLRRRAGRELLLAAGDPQLASARSPASDPVDELIEREHYEELEQLARVILSGLSGRQRAVVALHTRGLRRQQIAEHLDLSPRTVKRSMEQVLAAGRNELLRLAGQGCNEGEQIVARLAFGLAGPRDARRAQLHLATCGRCGAMYERLDLWREHVAGLLPIPAAAEAQAHLLERAMHAGSELISGSGSSRSDGSVRRHMTDAVSHLREQAAASYSRAVDPTPLAGVRPGAVAAAVAGCLAIGGGATYCVEQGVDPIAGIRTIASREQSDRKPRQHLRRARLSQAPAVPVATPTAPAPTPTVSAIPPATQPTSTPPPPQPTSTPTPPPAPQEEYEPTAVVSNSGSASSQPASSASSKPAPAPAGGPSEFGGP